ncbi:MAG: sodium/glutamate symporter [Gammaproteobacteria bacterium]|nr:MAG: sodium/glutamate symporter [Gammaproteobacteria bacterium]
MPEANIHEVGGFDVLIVGILVWFLGNYITERIHFLKANNIPPAVTGGLICSLIVTLVYSLADLQIVFDMRIRDLMLLVFFTTIGLSAKISLLKAGGKALAILLLVASIFLVVQNVTGVLLVYLMGHHPGYGLFGGSVSFAGGYGTAIAWGNIAEEAGLVKAGEIGIAFATFGLIAGGLLGGPIGERLIRKNKLAREGESSAETAKANEELLVKPTSTAGILATVMMLALCVELGDLVNRLLFSRGVTLPGFLTAMMCGIIITNGADALKIELHTRAIERFGEISLQIFLSMSLMSMQLWVLAQAVGPILLILSAQILVMTVFAVYIVFWVMGRDYDASVIASGFTGLGLGATPVGIANMNAITSKYAPSPKAFLVIPLVGAFFIDIVNALIIKYFAGLEIMSRAPLPT